MYFRQWLFVEVCMFRIDFEAMTSFLHIFIIIKWSTLINALAKYEH
jgi:hypothetical protein